MTSSAKARHLAPSTTWSITADDVVDGREPDHRVTTHSATLAFVGDLVVKRKRPVDLGFLDFRRLEDRVAACHREVVLNQRLGASDTYLGVTDVCDDEGHVVDAAIVMRRLPDDRRLATLARRGADAHDCVRRVGRLLATFHAGQAPSPRAHELAGPEALRRNWADNLAVLVDHPELAHADLVATLDDEVQRWLDGREILLDERVEQGFVRDGHGDLTAADVFCLDDGPRVLDCLDFAERYRVADIVFDVAFLAMDLERLGRQDLAATLLSTHAELLGGDHRTGLTHHAIAYRASVRAKVSCLVDDPDADVVADHLQIAVSHLHAARVRLVLVGGLPGTGKSTLATALSDHLGWAVLRSDELRKDLLHLGHTVPAGPDGYSREVTAGTYAELLDRARALLRRGVSVVLDASWHDARHRTVAAGVAAEAGAELHQLECRVPADVARRRLAARRGDASDADVTVHDAMAREADAWPGATNVDTGSGVDAARRIALVALDMPEVPSNDPDLQEDPVTSDRNQATDRQGLEVLDPETCLHLLDLSPVGRVAFVSAGEPVVLPVNHVRLGRRVYFRTASGITLDAAIQRATMAFEVDGYDEETRSGWSVLVRGDGDLEEDDEVLAELAECDLHPWADTVERPTWVRVLAMEVSGRRIPDVRQP